MALQSPSKVLSSDEMRRKSPKRCFVEDNERSILVDQRAVVLGRKFC